MGVTQNTNNTNLLGHGQRPNVVPGVDILTGGSITDRLRDNPDDNLYLNPAAFAQAPQGTIGNAPRYFEGVYSPWRNSTDMALNKDVSDRRIAADFPATGRDQRVQQPVVSGAGQLGARQHQLRPCHGAGELLANDASHGTIHVLRRFRTEVRRRFRTGSTRGFTNSRVEPSEPCQNQVWNSGRSRTKRSAPRR